MSNVQQNTESILRLGISSGALYPGTKTEEVPAIAERWGITDLELMPQTRGEHSLEYLRDIAREASDRGLRIHAVHAFQEYLPLFAPYRRRAAEGLLFFEQLIETAGTLGISTLVWHGPERRIAPSPDRWSDFLRVTGQIAERCHTSGVTLALENVSYCALATVRDLFAFAGRIPELGPPGSVGFAFDPFQAAEAGANPFMIISAMDGSIADVHLSDAKDDDPTVRHLTPGDGDLPWSALLRAIAHSGYDGPMMIEGPLDLDGVDVARVRSTFGPLIANLALSGNDAPLPAGIIEGIELFNAGAYYEAHEVIEHEWHAERGDVRRLYQGILQIGVGLHHTRSGNHRGAVLLLTDGIEKTSGFAPAFRGIDTARLVLEAQACLDQVVALGPTRLGEFDWSRVPTIHLPVGKAD